MDTHPGWVSCHRSRSIESRSRRLDAERPGTERGVEGQGDLRAFHGINENKVVLGCLEHTELSVVEALPRALGTQSRAGGRQARGIVCRLVSCMAPGLPRVSSRSRPHSDCERFRFSGITLVGFPVTVVPRRTGTVTMEGVGSMIGDAHPESYPHG